MSRVDNFGKDPLSMFMNALNPEGMERQAQSQLINSTQMPRQYGSNGDAVEVYTKMGIIVLGETNGDKLFYDVVLPEGWKKERTSHSMWNNLLDHKGRLRGTFFYKGDFWDRDAFFNVESRYKIEMKTWLSTEEKGHYEKQQVKRLNPEWQQPDEDVEVTSFDDDIYYRSFGSRRLFRRMVPKYIYGEEDVWIPKYKNTYEERNNTPHSGTVLDGKQPIFQTEIRFFKRKYRKDRHRQWWDAYQKVETELHQLCVDFLDKNYPDWKNPHAYWD